MQMRVSTVQNDAIEIKLFSIIFTPCCIPYEHTVQSHIDLPHFFGKSHLFFSFEIEAVPCYTQHLVSGAFYNMRLRLVLGK